MMQIPIKTAAEAAWNDFSLGMTQEKSIPDPLFPHHDASEQSLVSFSDMPSMKELKGTGNVKLQKPASCIGRRKL